MWKPTIHRTKMQLTAEGRFWLIFAQLSVLGFWTAVVGDLTEKKTCFKFSGSSLVDYVIISSRILNYVNYFVVNDLQPHLSDHCSLSFALMLKHKKRCSGKRSDDFTLSEFKKLVWDDIAKYVLCRLLKGIETKNRLNTPLNNNNVDAMTELFTQNLIDVCK